MVLSRWSGQYGLSAAAETLGGRTYLALERPTPLLFRSRSGSQKHLRHRAACPSTCSTGQMSGPQAGCTSLRFLCPHNASQVTVYI